MKAAAGPGAVYMAGGIDVVNRMKSGFPVTDLIHLGRIAGLDGIEEFDDGLRLGALVTHDRMATSPLVLARLPALAQTWPDVANIRIRCKATIGGNIIVGDPAYDFALAALAADARLHFLAADGSTRIVSATQPGGGLPDGLLTAIGMRSGSALRLIFDRSLRPIVTLVLGLDIDKGRVRDVRYRLLPVFSELLKPDAAMAALNAIDRRAARNRPIFFMFPPGSVPAKTSVARYY